MGARQLTERQKLGRDLRELIELRSLPTGSPKWKAAVGRMMMRKRQLSAADLEHRNKAWLAMGSPSYRSPEWKAELLRLDNARRVKRRVNPPGTDRSNSNSLYWRYMLLTAWQAGGKSVDLVELPGQRRERHTKEEQTEARRMYRWLWRTFPGLLKACDGELRAMIRRAGGIA